MKKSTLDNILDLKGILITLENREKIDAKLKKYNGRAELHTSTYLEIATAAEEAEHKLRVLGLPKRKRIGATAECFGSAPAEKRSYRYTAISSRFVIERRTAGWVLIEYEKERMPPRAPHSETVNVYLSQPQNEFLAQKSAAKFQRFSQ